MIMMKTRYVPLAKVPAVWGISRSTIYRAARAGQIEIRKVGRTSLVAVDCIERFINQEPALFAGSNAEAEQR
jgi:hypothetical protein